MNQKYTKEEHLKGYKLIKYLFEKGTWNKKYPLAMVYCPSPEFLETHKVGVSVSKKIFKHAVDRNRVKRLLRECFRLHKNELNNTFTKSHLLMIVYNGKDKKIPAYKELESCYLKLLEKIKFSD